MQTYWGSGSIAPCILDLGTRLRWVVSFTSRPLYPQRKTAGTHSRGFWVVPRAGLDTVVKRKIPSLCRKSNPRTPIIQPVAWRLYWLRWWWWWYEQQQQMCRTSAHLSTCWREVVRRYFGKIVTGMLHRNERVNPMATTISGHYDTELSYEVTWRTECASHLHQIFPPHLHEQQTSSTVTTDRNCISLWCAAR
jgi:hypothetical protein